MESPNIPKEVKWYEKFEQSKMAFIQKKRSYIADLTPANAVKLGVFEILEILHKRLDTDTLTKALNPDFTIESPVANHENTAWIKTSNMIGVNARTIDNFFNIVKYALTLPAHFDAIHLLPMWEPGVVSSLYGKTSWNINPEFFSNELQNAIPALNTVEKQLKVVVNLLHAMGKKVGMDVIPHTDRFSEMVFCYPRFFEWIKRDDKQLIAHHNELHREVEDLIWEFLYQNNDLDHRLAGKDKQQFFETRNAYFSHADRQNILFGPAENYTGRLEKRLKLIQYLLTAGFETLPMTMAPPYRGLHINFNDYIVDQQGNKWYTYEFDAPQAMSRVFGPLTRYKFFEVKPNSWDLDFDKPQLDLWQYIAEQYLACKNTFNLDFMRGDMAHVQPRPAGVPNPLPHYYDPLAFIKQSIIEKTSPNFGFYAETFLVEPNTMAYGDENEHLEAISADVSLGDIQSTVPGSIEFRSKLKYYKELLAKEIFSPCFTIITSDKDDPRFDHFYQNGLLMRTFCGIFFMDMPSYASLGFETRNQHLERGPNEEYSKLYVFKIEDNNETDKCTNGSFVFGKNLDQFERLQQLYQIADELLPKLKIDEFKMHTQDFENADYIYWQIGSFHFLASLVADLKIDNKVLSKYFEIGSAENLYFDKNTFECCIYKV